MNLKYISDDNGKTKGVFIPIRDWNLLKKKYKLAEEDIRFTAEQKKELNHRVDDYLKNPDEVSEWEDVKQRLLARNK